MLPYVYPCAHKRPPLFSPHKPKLPRPCCPLAGGRFCVASRTGGVAAKRPAGAGAGAGSRPAAGSGRPEDEDDGPEWPLGWLLNGCGGLAVDLTGPLLWRWKDGIDRAFMRRWAWAGVADGGGGAAGDAGCVDASPRRGMGNEEAGVAGGFVHEP